MSQNTPFTPLDASEVAALCALVEAAATTNAPEKMSALFSSLDSGEKAACCEAAADA